MSEEAAWVSVQKKTFTKWSNSHLKKVGTSVNDLQYEFDNGIKLMQLVKSLYGTEIPKHNPAPKMRPQQLDNITLALDMVAKAQIKTNFLKATHLADHDLKMILGMIWAIILDYQIKGISVEELSAKEALLLWCQRKTKGYENVKVDNFSGSWRDGLALCALIHKHRPDLLDFNSLNKSDNKANIQLAFDIAEKHLGISPLLDVDDLDVDRPDERSVMTYISEFYHKFTSQDHKENAARRVQKFARFHENIEALQGQYDSNTHNLLGEVSQHTQQLNNHAFPESYDQTKALLAQHKAYRKNVKPQLNERKLEGETAHASIQAQLRTNKRKAWTPSEETSPATVDAAFQALADAERSRAKALREHLAQQKDHLHKQYAEKAQNTQQWLQGIKVSSNDQSGEIADQLANIEKQSADLAAAGPLKETETVFKELELSGLEDDNPYTDTTYDELATEADQLSAALEKKKQFLESQLAAANNKTGLTPEQINELKEAFKHFDKSGDGTLDKLEFRSCLQTLGQTYPDDAFNNVYGQAANGGEKVPFDSFVDYMGKLMEDTDDAAQIKQSFKILSNEQPLIKKSDLYVSPLEESDVNFLTTRMPGETDQFDFATYTDDKFAA